MRLQASLIPLLAALCALPASADTRTRELLLDFNSLVKSRDLSGFALREDGRIQTGPVLEELKGELPGVVWSIAPLPSTDANAPQRWIVGTGPEASLVELSIAAGQSSFETKPWANLGAGNAQALLALDDRTVVVVTSPDAVLFLVRDGKIVSRVPLGTEAAWELVRGTEGRLILSTGNPARVLSVDPTALESAGTMETPPADAEAFAKVGVRVEADLSDRHVRSVLVARDGRIFAGTSPKGNVYLLTGPETPAKLLTEGREGEVTDLIETAAGSILASITFGQAQQPSAGDPADALIQAMQLQMEAATAAESMPAAGPRQPRGPGRGGSRAARESTGFSGQGGLHDVTPGRAPEVLFSRPGVAFYALAEQDGRILIAGGERGDLLAWDPVTRKGSVLAGSASAQNVAFTAPDENGSLLVLRNNLPGLSRLTSNPKAARSLNVAALDLGATTRLGSLRIDRLRPEGAATPSIQFQTTLGADDAGTWSEWTDAALLPDGRYDLAGTQARRMRVKFAWAEGTGPIEGLSRVFVYHLPRNQAPQLQSFRILPQNVGLIRNPEPPQPPFVPLMQYLQGNPNPNGQNNTPGGAPAAGGMQANMRNQGFLGSPLVQAVGTQIVVWNVTDGNGDDLLHTLSLRREDETAWTEIVVGTRDNHAQFDVSSLKDGPYVLRLVSRERTTHPDGALELVHEDDSLVIDNSLPEVLAASTEVKDGRRIVTITGRDATSRLDYAMFLFNNGREERVGDPADGILDSREETFTLSIPEALVADATSVEAVVFDASGSGQVRRLTLTR